MSSASIDERIVKLMFDNKLFEQNAQTSISTLEKLKQALKLDDASKSLDALEKKMSNQTSLEKIGKTVDSLKDRFSAGGIVGMRVLQNLTDSAMNMGKKLMDAVSVPLEQIKSGGWTRAMNLEQAKFQIESLGASWEKVYKDMDFAVTGTAYGMDSAAKVAAQLTASGIEAGDEMAHVLRGISGVAAMTGSTYEDIGNIMATVAGNGRLYAQQLNQFAYRGLNATAILAKHFNTTEEEIRKMVKAGEIDFRTFGEVMYEAFGESAVRANELFSGALSNTKAALSRIGADVAANSLTQFRDVLNACRIAVNNFHTSLGGPNSGLLGDINNVVTAVSQGIVKFMSDDRFTKAMDKFAKGLQNGFKIITSSMTALRDIFSIKFFKGQDANDVFLSLMTSFQKFTKSLSENKSLTTDIYHIFGGIVTIFKQLGITIGQVAGGVSKFFSTFQGLKVLNNLIKSFKNVLMGVKSVLEPIGKAFMNVFGDTNWKWVTTASRKLKDFTKQLRLSESASKKVEEIFTKVFTAIKNIGEAAGEIAGGALKKLGEVWEKLAPNGIKITEGTKEVEKHFGSLGTLVDKTVKVFEEGDKATQASYIKGIIAKLAANPISGPILKAVDQAILAFEKFKQNLPEDLIKKFGETVTNVFTKIKDTIVKWATDAIEHLKKLDIHFENPITTLKKLGKALVNAGTKIGDFIKKLKPIEKFKSVIDKLKESGSGLFELIGQGLEKVKEFISSTLLGGEGGGLSKVLDTVGDAFTRLGKMIGDFINQLDISKVVAIGYVAMLTAITIGVYNLLTGLGDMTKGVGSFFKRGGEFLESLKPIKESRSTLESAAIAITAVSAALFVLSQVPFDDLVHGLMALGAVILGTTGFLAALEGLAYVMKNGDFVKEFSQLAKAIPLIAGSVFVLTLAMKQLDSIKTEGLFKKVIALGLVITELGVLAAAMNHFLSGDGGNFQKNALGVLLFSASLYTIANAMVKLADIPWKKAYQAFANAVPVLGIATIVSLMISKLTFSAGAGFMLGVAGLQLLIMVLENLGKKNWDSLKHNIESFGGILTAFIGIVGLVGTISALIGRLTGLNIGKMAKDFGTGMLGMAGAVYLVALACEKIGKMDDSVIKKGSKVVGALIVIFGLFGTLSRLGRAGNYKGMALSFVGVALAISSLVGAIYLLGSMDSNVVKRGTIAVSALIVFMGLFGKLTAVGNGKAMDAKAIASLAGTIIVLSLSLIVLAQLSWDEIARGLTAMGVALTEFVTAFAVIQKVGEGKTSVKDIVLIGVLVAAAGGVAFALSQLANYEWEKLIAAAVSMGLCLIAIADSFMVLSVVNSKMEWKTVGKSIAELVVGVLAVLALAGALRLLSDMSWDQLIAAGAGIGLLLAAISGSFAILNTVNAIPNIKTIAASVGELAAGVVAVIGLIWAIKQLESVPTDKLIAACDGISKLMLSLGVTLGIVGTVAAIGGPAVATGVDVLLVTIGILVVAITMIGAACNEWSALEQAIMKGLEVLGKIGEGIGTAIGKFVNGIVNTVVDNLPHVAEQLSVFTEALKPFVKNISKIDENTVKSANLLAQTISALATADLQQSFTLFDGQTSNIDSFSSNVVKVGAAVKKFAKEVKDIPENAVENAATMSKVAKRLVDFANSVPREGGIWQHIVGENGFSSFVETLSEHNIGKALKKFAKQSEGISLSAVENGANAGKMIAEFAKSIGNTGGLIAQIVGDNTLGDFAAQLLDGGEGKTIGAAIKQFGIDVDGISTSNVEDGANAGKMITDFANSIGNDGGFIAQVFGDNKIADLAAGLMDDSGGARIGAAIAQFITDIEGVSKKGPDKAADAGATVTNFVSGVKDAKFGGGITKGLKNLASALNESEIGPALASFITSIEPITSAAPMKASMAGSVVLNFVSGVADANINKTKLVNIAKGLTDTSAGYTIGQAIRQFEASIASLNQAAVQRASDAAAMVTNFLNGMKSVGTRSIPNFGTQLVTLGKKVQEFADTMQKVNATGIATVADNIIKTIQTLSSTTVSSAVQAMTTQASDFTKVGNTVVIKIAEGMKAKQTDLNNAGKTLVSTTANSLRSGKHYDAFKAAGNYLAAGFAAGISSGSGATAASKAGAALATKALTAIRKAAVIESPSKKAAELGAYIDEGFANGMTYNSVKVVDAAKGIVGKVVDKIGEGVTPVAEKGKELIGSFTGSSDALTNLIPIINSGTSSLNGMTTAATGTAQAMDSTKKSTEDATKAVEEQQTWWESIKGAVLDLTNTLNGSKPTADQANQNLAIATDKVSGLGEKILQTKDASRSAATSAGEDAENTKSHLAELTEAYNEYHDSLASTISGQINLFEAREKAEAISSEQMVKNMQSQVKAVSDWEKNIKQLAKSGIDQGLLMELAKLGPEGEPKVAAFVSMTDKQLSKVNHIYRKKLSLEKNTADEIMASMASVGKGLTEQLAGNIDTHAVDQKMNELGNNVVEQVKVGAGITVNGGASEKTKEVGKSIVDGVGTGIDEDTPKVTEKINTFTTTMTTNIANAVAKFSETKTVHILQGFIDGINQDQREMYTKLETTFKEVDVKVNNFAKKFMPAGEASIQGYGKGIENKKNVAVQATEKVLKAISSAMEKMTKQKAPQLGKDLTLGFAKGMTASGALKAVEKAAKEVVQTALEAIYDEAEEGSPSRLSAINGKWLTEGFGIGMTNPYAISTVKTAAARVVDAATDTFMNVQSIGESLSTSLNDAGLFEEMERVIDDISNSINNHMDSNPILMPMLDLSRLERDAQSVSRMFNEVTLGGSFSGSYDYEGNPITPMQEFTNRMEAINAESSDAVVNAVDRLRSDVTDLSKQMSNLQVVMDSGTLVGAISSEVDTRLGMMETYRGRGV